MDWCNHIKKEVEILEDDCKLKKGQKGILETLQRLGTSDGWGEMEEYDGVGIMFYTGEYTFTALNNIKLTNKEDK